MKKIISTLVLFLVPSIILANEINNIDMKIYVDNNSHLTGALGVAILSRAEEEIDFSFDIEDIIFETKGTECKGCSNNCEIIKVMRDNKIIDSWGNRCPRGELVHK